MNVMVDYDGTYTSNPKMWRTIIHILNMENTVYLVTSRDPDDIVEDVAWFENNNIPIIYCDYKAKRQVCEAQGVKIDIWIDDNPKFIDTSYPDDIGDYWRNKKYES